jgi:hypothetical protein
MGGIVIAAVWVAIGAVIVANTARTRGWWVPGAASLSVALIFMGLYAFDSGDDDRSIFGFVVWILGEYARIAMLAGAISFAVFGIALLAIGHVLRRRYLRQNAASSATSPVTPR